MPKMNLVMENGLLGRWYKSAGDIVAEGDPLCGVENEKETEDITAAVSGTLLKIWGEEGGTYPVAAPRALIGAPDEGITDIVKRIEDRLAETAGLDSAKAAGLKPAETTGSKAEDTAGWRPVEAAGPMTAETYEPETTAAAEVPEAPAAPAAASDIKMLPKLRRMIRDKGIDIDDLIAFCGKDRVTEQDIADYEAARAGGRLG